jgi:hypothetical protein
MTDLTALEQGLISVTPLNYDMTHRSQLAVMESWDLNPADQQTIKTTNEKPVRTGPTIRTTTKN